MTYLRDCMSKGIRSGVHNRVAEYLSSGGLFNPELMEHEKVRDLILSLQEEIEKLRSENEKMREGLEFYGDKDNWRFEYRGDKRNTLPKDIDQDDIGGEKAREILKDLVKV